MLNNVKLLCISSTVFALSILSIGAKADVIFFHSPHDTNELGFGRVYNLNDKSISVYIKQTFTIAIPSNPTTGYSLSIKNPLPNNIKFLSKWSYPNCEPPMVGCGRTEYFTFEAVEIGAGDIPLTFVYERAWDPTTKNYYKFNIDVQGFY